MEERIEIEQNSSCCVNMLSFECAKFFVCVIISFTSMAFGIYLLIHDEFKNTAVSTFAVSLITNVISFWVSPPEIKSDTSKSR